MQKTWVELKQVQRIARDLHSLRLDRIKVHKFGDLIRRRFEVKRGYLKVHIAVIDPDGWRRKYSLRWIAESAFS